METGSLISYLKNHPESSRSQIKQGIAFLESESSLKRLLAEALHEGSIIKIGSGKNTRYSCAGVSDLSRRYPDGIQTFEKIIYGGYVYVDKTDLIYRLTHESSRNLFLSRPRRFGKSLLISTLQAYFEGRKELFDNLAISRLEKKWSAYPVIRLDLSTAGDALDSDQLYLKLGNILKENEERFGLSPEEMLPGERLYALVRRVYEKTGSEVVLLIDEYDAPILTSLWDEPKNNLFRAIVKELFSPIKKLDPYLHFTFLTGITKFSQMSIFSTLNNLNDISMDDEYASLCGFTEDEIEGVFDREINELAQKEGTDKEVAARAMKQRYDGYHFSPACIDIYNPYSILRVFSSMRMGDYWFASGTPTVLFDTLRHFNMDLYDIDGVEVTASAFSQPTEMVNNAVSLFYQSGYLTIKSFSEEFDTYVLSIPNAEVRAGLMDNLMPIALGKSQIESQNVAIRFKRALVQNDIDQAISVLKGFFASIPYPEFGSAGKVSFTEKEAYFKRLFYLVFSFMNIQIYTEVMNSEGRTDAVMYIGDKVYVIEAKLDAASAQEAINQINTKGYADRFLGTGVQVKKLGLNFSSKTRTIADWIISD